MKKLKDEFTFSYNNQEIKVKLCGEVYCAIFGKLAKPLDIEIYEDNQHKGKISVLKGKFLSWLPSDAFEGVKKTRATHTKLIKRHNLSLFCEICLNDQKGLLEVHHIKEHAITQDDCKENLRVYCTSCHDLVHAIRTINRRITRKFNPDLSREDYDTKINN